jgi:hypothetical protein
MRIIPRPPGRAPGPSCLTYDVPDGSWGQDALRGSLAETVRWCASRANLETPATCLRTPGLQPRVMVDTNRFQMMDRLLRERGHALRCGPAPSTSSHPAGPLQGGRLLVYFPEDNTCDGGAALATGGYFDDDNVPPWDTWVGMFREDPESDLQTEEYLIAWVPPVFLDTVARGIEANPERCLQWLEDSTTLMARRLADLR